MTRVINFGSINIDHVYQVDHFVRPGETLSSNRYRVFAGGKGFNQSIALARAGVHVVHVGRIGRDGDWLLERLKAEGVDTTFVRVVDEPTGHAIIQVNANGENAIVLYCGANHCLTTDDIEESLRDSTSSDVLLVQNETNAVAQIIQCGARRGLNVVFNPAPMSADVQDFPLEQVGLFIVNEIEAQALTGETLPERVGAVLKNRFPQAAAVLTLGPRGAMFFAESGFVHQSAMVVKAIDTTAAGDTFIGYFLAEYVRTKDPRRALGSACRAAAICVTRPGAADSIPKLSELS